MTNFAALFNYEKVINQKKFFDILKQSSKYPSNKS